MREVITYNMKNFVGRVGVGKMKIIERDDLKHCPFCGNTDVELFSQLIESSCSWWDADVYCSKCGVMLSIGAKTEEEAINSAVKSWNNRV